MEAGKRRHRITVQQLVAGSPQQLPNGEPDVTWTDYLSDWAAIEPLNGREVMVVQQMQMEVEGKITLNYRPGVTGVMRVVFGSIIYDIVNVLNPEMRNKDLVLWFKTGSNNG